MKKITLFITVIAIFTISSWRFDPIRVENRKYIRALEGEKDMQYFVRIARQEYPDVCSLYYENFELGVLYLTGIRGQKNYEKGLNMIKNESEKNNKWADIVLIAIELNEGNDINKFWLDSISGEMNFDQKRLMRDILHMNDRDSDFYHIFSRIADGSFIYVNIPTPEYPMTDRKYDRFYWHMYFFWRSAYKLAFKERVA